MSLTVDEVCEQLEREHQHYTAQQKQAEQVFHQCSGDMTFIKAKIDDIRKTEEEKAKAESQSPEPQEAELIEG